MSLPSKIFYNTLAQTAGKIISIAIGLFTLGILTRYLGEQGFGQYSTVIAFMGFVAVLADLGLYLVVVREISRPESDNSQIISNALGLRLITAVTMLLGGALAALVFPYDQIVKQSMFIAALAFLFVPLHQVLMGIFQKHLATYLPTISETLGRLVSLVLVFLFAARGLSLPYFVGALIAGNGIIFLLVYLLARRYERFSFAFDWRVWISILKKSWPLAFAVILNLTYFKGDTIILSLFQSPEAVGIYSLPYKVLEVLLAFPAMFVGLMMPTFSAAAFTDWPRFRQIIQRAFEAIGLLVLPLIITTFYFAQDIIDLIKGDTGFADSPSLLRLLILAAGTIFLGTLFGYAVVAVKKEKTMVWGYAAGAVIGLVLYLLLIPRYSYWGAAVSTIIIEIVVASTAFWLVRKTSGLRLSPKVLLLSLPGVLAMSAIFHFADLWWVGEIILGLGIYTGFLFAFGAIPLNFLREIDARK